MQKKVAQVTDLNSAIHHKNSIVASVIPYWIIFPVITDQLIYPSVF